MSPGASLLLGIVCLVLAIGALVPVLDFQPSTRRTIKSRIQSMQAKAPGADQAARTKQLTAKNPELGILRVFVTRGAIAKLERDLGLAGKTSAALPMIIVAKVVAPVLVALLGYSFAAKMDSPMWWLVYAGIVVVSYFAPGIIVNGRAVERQKRMMYDLPDILDQITISIEAGMGFESALSRVGQNNRGPLGEEIVRTVQDMNLGVSRRDAYLALASRNDVDDLKRFTKSIVQAEEFGVPISGVVRIQAEEMRDKRRARARETAQKVPVKLLFPMLTCVMPVLFMVILTPAILALGDAM
ncbi:type II secretion system F family protein [Aeromicrobium stalagmiti]|uniref:type II secretion system F family protein n=1 Tax=Aeromicrobium stalagmiti TaxID=2738988 RepID=UPI001568B7B5|nr:type II secretion system F family protein [Aeromicrobium stalagmiti]NRQ48290.1 type II secretion system F family protein [Aeromicrobium stalagmiti]